MSGTASRRKAKPSRRVQLLFAVLALIAAAIAAYQAHRAEQARVPVSLDEIPPYSGEAYIETNDNVPFFTADELTTDTFETYSELDSLGRCGVAYANICMELMPTEPRGKIGSIKPSGWHTIRYNGLVEGNYLYNRCHLIGYQLAGENANPKNLITGTRYLNTIGMLPFENQVNDYVDETDNHVLYRVTPVFEGDNLVASGVLMEAYSVEDAGGLAFCVYCYNVQPGITIDYATGDSWLTDGSAAAAAPEESPDALPDEAAEASAPAADATDGAQTVYISESGTKYHREDCRYVKDGSRELTEAEAEAEGYSACGTCKP